jgi:hypothetical protein
VIDVFSVTLENVFNDARLPFLDLPLDVSPDHIHNSHDLRRDIGRLMLFYAYWGMMVYNRMIPLGTLDLLVGGTVRGCRIRLHTYVETERRAQNIPAYGEWFQWLAERLEQYPQPEKEVGAHMAFFAWRP